MKYCLLRGINEKRKKAEQVFGIAASDNWYIFHYIDFIEQQGT